MISPGPHLLAVLALAALTAPVAAEKLVTQLSTDTVEITSSFDGERMTFFGNIEPDAGAPEQALKGPYNVAIVVIGPTLDRVAREKTHNFGIWLNTDQVTFKDFPSFYHVLSSGRLNDIADPLTLASEKIYPEAQAGVSSEAGWWKSTQFGHQLTRLMSEQNLFGLHENAVTFQSTTVYSGRLTLPSGAPPGRYIAVIYAFKNGKIVGRDTQGFVVRKIGFERFLAIESRQQPLLYGIICVVLGLFTGWLGGVLFKRN